MGGFMSDEAKQYDAGHLSFLELVRVITTVAGPAFASGALLKTGAGIARRAKPLEYPNFDAFVAAIAAGNDAIASFEGKARHYGGGVFGLPTCPFANSVKTYKSYVGNLPEEYASVTDHFNRPSPTTEKLQVGHQAGVSPFCCVHQTLRSAIADHISVGGRPLVVYQLGCKSGSGVRGIADKFLQATGISHEQVGKVLDENMCCYFVTIQKG
jgi:hypothetical protein